MSHTPRRGLTPDEEHLLTEATVRLSRCLEAFVRLRHSPEAPLPLQDYEGQLSQAAEALHHECRQFLRHHVAPLRSSCLRRRSRTSSHAP